MTLFRQTVDFKILDDHLLPALDSHLSIGFWEYKFAEGNVVPVRYVMVKRVVEKNGFTTWKCHRRIKDNSGEISCPASGMSGGLS